MCGTIKKTVVSNSVRYTRWTRLPNSPKKTQLNSAELKKALTSLSTTSKPFKTLLSIQTPTECLVWSLGKSKSAKWINISKKELSLLSAMTSMTDLLNGFRRFVYK